MMGLLSNIIFTSPWILAGLVSLPALWLLLRIMPPAPKRITLPTTRFLAGLVPEEQTPAHTPPWILLLRLMIAALVLLALAGPIYNPGKALDQKPGGTIRIVLDNDWAAQTWKAQKQAAEDLLSRAARENAEAYILTTAPPAVDTQAMSYGPVPASEALSILRGLEPLPWEADYKQALKAAETNKPDSSVTTFWLGHGLSGRSQPALLKILQAQGPLTYIGPNPENMPLALTGIQSTPGKTNIEIDAPSDIPDGLPVAVQALGKNGAVIDRQETTLAPAELPRSVSFEWPERLRSQISQFKIEGRNSAGSTILLDDQFQRRTVGILAPAEDSENAPLVEAAYYLERALSPYADLQFGDLDAIMEADPSMIILPDIGGMPAQSLNTLEAWVRGGGLLLRFAGPNTAQSQGETFLTPVPLRRGGRSLDGSMTWQTPAKLAPFEESSPLYGLSFGDPVTVHQQILAEPSEELNGKSWAKLEDGTPLITAAPLNRGLTVMIHTTATPQWSDLALSGLYVDILRRMASLAGTSHATNSNQTRKYLEPLLLLDGFGAKVKPQSHHKPIEAAKLNKTQPGPDHPPGIYGHAGMRQALNLGRSVTLSPVKLPLGVVSETYGGKSEHNLMPYLLYAATALLLLDWLIMIVLSAGLRPNLSFAGCVLIFFSVAPATAMAQSANDLAYADGFYLAYMRTGNPSIDAGSQRGLESLAKSLASRTSAEPDGVIGLNPETDTLAFFPIIYWPVTTDQTTLSPKALNNVQFYLDHGGTILFDTRDQHYTTGTLGGTKNTAALRTMMRGLNVPPLAPMPESHVLSKTFYLMDTFPGRYSGGTIWVEQKSQNGRDGVSSVIIGGHDWAGAWAANRATLPGGGRQQELATRFGVNLVMYALTGNYKADQVHVPHILERLDQ